MCLRYLNLKTKNPCGISHAYVPCGVCADCRRKLQSAWQFRINSEFLTLIKRGWYCGFATLTYNNENLPHIPVQCFKNADYEEIPCFNRLDVSDFIVSVRDYLKYHCNFVGENRIRYFVASELGTLRHRPHYHLIIAWPPTLSYKDMHRILSDKWQYGYLFPRNYQGDKRMKSFEVVGDASKVFSYISKYVCKDLELEKIQGDKSRFYSERGKYEEGTDEFTYYRLYRNTQSFHLQSRSLGFEAIAKLSDDDKMRVFVDGMSFTADDDVRQIPLYIKNKLVFDPYYTIDSDGKRLVQRKASDFFLRHAHEIFVKKAEWYTKYIKTSLSAKYYVDRGLGRSFADEIERTLHYHYSRVLDKFSTLYTDDRFLGEYYLAYHRVHPSYRYDIPLLQQWLFRWYPDVKFKPRMNFDYDFNFRLAALDVLFEHIDGYNSLLGSFGEAERADSERKVNKCRDYFNNILKKVG